MCFAWRNQWTAFSQLLWLSYCQTLYACCLFAAVSELIWCRLERGGVMQCTRSTLAQMDKCQIPKSLIKPPPRCICLHACFTRVLLLVLLWHHRKAFKDAPPPISFPPPFLVSSPLCFQQIFTQIVGTSLLKLGGGENSRNDCWRGRKVGGRDGAMFRAVSSGFYPCQPDTVPFAHRLINPAWWLL